MKMNNKGLKFLTVLSIIAVVLAFSVVLVSATDAEPNVSNTWYVYQTAESAGTGSQADPFKAFISAIDAANDGDTIKFIGDYTTTNEDKINLKGKGVTITSADTENVSTITGIISLSEDAWNTATHPITGDLGFVDLQMSLESMIGWEGSYDPDAEPGTCGALRTETVNGITITFNGCTFDSDCYDSTIRLCDVGSIDVIISECTFIHSGETRESGSDMRAVALSSYNANSGSTLTVSDSVFTNYQRSIYVTNFTSLDVQDSEITPHPTKKTGKTSINIAGAVQGLEVFVDNVTLNDNPEGKPFVLFHDSADGCSIKSFEVHGDVYTDDGDGKTLTIAQNGTFIVPDDGSFNLGYGGHDWTLVNSGSIVDSGAIINGGIITNNGEITISNESGAEALVIDGATAKITGNVNKTGKIISSAAYPIIIKEGTIENQTINLGVVSSYGITVTAENGNVALKDNSITSSGERFVAVSISTTGKEAMISGNTFIQGDASKGIKSVLMVGPGEAVAWPENTVVTITDNDFSKVTKYRETFGAGGGHEAGAHAYDSKSIRILAQTAKIGLSTGDGAQIVVDNDADIGMVSGTTNDAHLAPADWTWVKESDVQIVSSMSLNSLGILDGKVTVPVGKTLTVKNLQVAGPMIVNGTLIVTGESVINSDSYPEADQWDTGSITVAVGGVFTNNGSITNDTAITCLGTITNEGTITNNGSIVIGSSPLYDVTKVEGQITFNGTTVTGGAGSKITWGDKSLTAGSDSEFTVAPATMSPTITAGTVTLDKADIYGTQIVTVNTGATLVISGAMTIQSGGKIVVNTTETASGTVKFGSNVMGDVTEIKGQIAFDGTKTLTAASGSKITWGTEVLEATSGTFEIAVDTLDTVVKTGNVTMSNATIAKGQIVTIDDEATLIVDGTLTNAGVINVEGILTDSYSAVTSQMIINTNGTINVAKTGTLKVGYFTGKGVNIDGKINFAAGGKFYNFAGAENKLISSGTDAALIMLSVGNVTIDAKEVGGAVTYTLQKDAKAAFVQSNLAGFAFKAGDLIDINGELTVATMITIPEGAKLNVNSKVVGDEISVIALDKTATLDIGSSASVSVGTIDMTGSNAGVKAVMIKAGGVITALIDGSTIEAESKANLENIVAGYGGISIIKGSVYINGTLATPDATGKITVPAGAVKISGNVEEGVTLEVPAGSSIVIPKDSTLTFEEGSKFNYDNAATITFEEKSSSIIYEKGSEVNDVVIEVETKEDSEGITVAVHIYLVSENEKKLIISVNYVEVLPGKTYGDALNDVIVTPMKKTVTFDGWYNLAFNEKIRSTDIVGNYDVVLTACYSEEGRVIPVPDDDDSGSSVVPASSSNINEFALPIAFILLVCSIFALGFVIIRKK